MNTCPTCSNSVRWPEWVYVDGHRIKEIREEQERSQVAIAAEARVTQGYLSRVEGGYRNKIGPELAFRLCRALGVDLDEIRE